MWGSFFLSMFIFLHFQLYNTYLFVVRIKMVKNKETRTQIISWKRMLFLFNMYIMYVFIAD